MPKNGGLRLYSVATIFADKDVPPASFPVLAFDNGEACELVEQYHKDHPPLFPVEEIHPGAGEELQPQVLLAP